MFLCVWHVAVFCLSSHHNRCVYNPSVAALLVTLLSATISVCLIVLVSISKRFQKFDFAQNSKGHILFKMMETF